MNIGFSKASLDNNIFPSVIKRMEAISISNNAFDLILSQNNQDKSKVLDSTEKKNTHADGSYSEEEESALTKHENVSDAKRKQHTHSSIKKEAVDGFSSDKDESVLFKSMDKTLSDTKKKQPTFSPSKKETVDDSSSEEDEKALSKRNDESVSDAKRKQSTRSPSKKVKSFRDSIASHDSSDEQDSISANNRNTESAENQASEEERSDTTKSRSGKENISEMRKVLSSNAAKMSPSKTKNYNVAIDIPDNRLNTNVASSEVLPEVATLEEESSSEERKSNLLSVIETTPQNQNDGTKSVQKKDDGTEGAQMTKTMSPGKKSELYKISFSKDNSEYFHIKSDTSFSSTPKENDIPMSHLGVENARCGLSSKPLSNFNSSSDKPSSTIEVNDSSNGEKNSTEKQTVSDSCVKKIGLGHPRKSEASSISQSKSTDNSVSPPVLAVESKPQTRKRKNNEVQTKSNKKAKKDKQADAKESSTADDEEVAGSITDKRDSVVSKKKPKASGKTTSSIQTDEKTNPIYVSSDDPSHSEQTTSRDELALKKKLRFSCHKCDSKFALTQQLFDHTCEGKRGKGFACERCDKIYKLRSTYVNHKFIHSKKKPYSCGICGQGSSSQGNHLNHMKKFHPGREPFPCEIRKCRSSFMTRTEQTVHHKKQRHFICRYCDEVFGQGYSLSRHMYNVHEIHFSQMSWIEKSIIV